MKRPFAWIYKNSQKSTFDEDGPWSLGRIYDQMLEEGLLDVFFYEGRPSRQWFEGLNFGLSEMVFAAYDNTDLLVFARVNNMIGRSGMMHFCYFRDGMDTAREIADDFHSFMAESGMKSLLGLTPKPYRHAIKFAESVGFVRSGVLPGACYMARNGKFVDGVLTVKTLTTGE